MTELNKELLPALKIELTGQVVASNLVDFKIKAMEVFESVNTDLKTEEDFALAEKNIKWLKEIEDKLEAAKRHALSQTVSIKLLFETVDEIKEEARQKRLSLERPVKTFKETLKASKIAAAEAELDKHIESLQAELELVRLRVQRPNFAEATKGLKTEASVDKELSYALLQGKTQADGIAKDFREKTAIFKRVAVGYEFLFLDLTGDMAVTTAAEFEQATLQKIEGHKAQMAERERLAQEYAARQAAQEVVAQEVVAQDTIVPVMPAVDISPVTKAEQDPTLTAADIGKRLGLRDFFNKNLPAEKKYTEYEFQGFCDKIRSHIYEVSDMYLD